MIKNNFLRKALYLGGITTILLSSCKKSDGPNTGSNQEDGTRWITLTSALPGENATTPNGNGGTYAHAVTHEQAIDPNYTLDIYPAGNRKHIESTRTSRVQASSDGGFLYDIQYIGPDPGLFQAHTVNGKADYRKHGREVNTHVILGNTPRWIKSTDELAIGVNSDGTDKLSTQYTGTGVDAVFNRNVRTVAMAILDLKNYGMINTRNVPVAFPEELASQGYTIGRTDVPIINSAQNKVYIGALVSKIDPSKPTLNANGTVTWANDPNINIGTATIVVDYPTLRNPEIIISEKATGNNHGYRTKTQYVGTDGHVYQAVMAHTVGHKIVRIDKSTDKYDNTYEFDLNTALSINDADIAAWTYIKDGIGIVLYRRGGQGAYVALIDLNTKTATALSNELETDEGMGSVLSQYQNIGVAGDYAYVPLTPSSKDGNVYVVNWKTKTITKGAKLMAGSLAHYIGSY